MAAALVVLVAGGLYGVLANHAGRQAPAAGNRATTGAAEVPPIDAVTTRALWALVTQAASADSDTVRQVLVVRSTWSAALRTLMQTSTNQAGDQPVWAVQAEATHEFVCSDCPVPPPVAGHAAIVPTGRYLLLFVRADTLQSTGDVGLDKNPADLAQLGPVLTLPALPH